jgi:hypothetical protein
MLNNKVKLAISIMLIGIIIILLVYILRVDRIDRIGIAQIHWVDCVQINGIKYHGDNKESTVDTSSIDKKIGEVKFNVSKMVHNPSYRFRDGDATFLDVGTEIYSLRSESNAIAAKIGEQYFLYKSK